ncbi:MULTISPECIES: GYDIA family GHMP kinase [unclassified Halobacteriovorax]|uniref:GYDIA family GHMP kinase n=1 Tax=unclassified Halobacteriovorax TaxID=2639665 RepID=UPI000EA016B1|nr:GYDIA family GHMP kinase [Halobacteriovorax sp. BALOs_7]AYF44467.1 hypothetical protein BALOs_1466 [Halobacteriovorax sp. BALOs_7]
MNTTHTSNNILKYLEGEQFLELPKNGQLYFGHGKLLLSGEYFVLDGAKALGLPTTVGQSLRVQYSSSFDPKLYWKSYDPAGKLWFEVTFEFWHFNILNDNPTKEMIVLQQMLRQARRQNKHFLRDGVDVHVVTQLGFPLEWGLGSSSTLIHNIADWAMISPFELAFNTLGGSGYDIACAQSEEPIIYQKGGEGPNWSPIEFNPSFKNNLYFIYLGHKKNSRDAIEYYNELRPHSPEIINTISELSMQMATANTQEEFNFLIRAHEDIVSSHLKLSPIKKEAFSDFDGEIKSLGAWGGDFILASSNGPRKYVKNYFDQKGLKVCIPYRELIVETQTPSEIKNVH